MCVVLVHFKCVSFRTDGAPPQLEMALDETEWEGLN